MIPVETSYSRLFDDVAVDAPPAAKILRWQFAPGEASVATEKGLAEVDTIEVEFSVVQQSCPFNLGRLLSYEREGGTIANIAQEELAMGDGRTVRAIVSRHGAKDDGEPV